MAIIALLDGNGDQVVSAANRMEPHPPDLGDIGGEHFIVEQSRAPGAASQDEIEIDTGGGW